MKYCNKCGNETKGNEKFCRKCGAKLSAHKEESKKEEKKQEHKEACAPKKRTWKTYVLYTFLVLLVLSLAFTSYQYYYYFKEYNNYYAKFKYEESEKERYINLFNTEKQNKEFEIEKRRQTESQLSDAQATIQTKNTEISGLRGTLTEEQRTRSTLQSELSETEQALGQKSQEVATVKKEVQEIIDEIGKLEYWVKSNAKLTSNTLSKVHGLVGSPISYSGGSCTIDANEMGSDMYKMGFTWVDDYETSNAGTPERIFDIDTFWQSKEGDCDDFAFFMSSWLRSEYEIAKSSCSEKDIYVQVSPDSWFSSGKTIRCPCDFHSVCGSLASGGGHCEVGITNSGDAYSGVSYANNAYIVEPQGGAYQGYGSNEFTNIRYIFSHDDFITYYKGPVKSLQIAKQKAQNIDLS